MVTALRKSLIIVACLVAVLSIGSGRTWAEDGQSSGAASQGDTADKPSDAAKVPCPYAPEGGCCEACQEKAGKAGGSAAMDPADCPCKRARQAGQGS